MTRPHRKHQRSLRFPASSTWLAIVLAAASQGCGDAPDSEDLGVTYDTIAGVEHVISTDRGAWVDEGVAWRVNEAAGVSIGVPDGADEYVFGRISGVVVDSLGRVHVAEPQAKEIRVFSPEGAFLHRWGRDGEGPGEFRHISGLALAPNGIAALDGRLNRLTVFAPSGDVLRMFRIERPYMILEHYAPMAFDSLGRFFDRARLSTMAGVDLIGVITYVPDGTPADTAFLAEIREDAITLERNGVRYMSIPRPFAPRASFTFGPAGTVYLTRGGEYRVDVFSPAGDSLRTIRRPVEPLPVTDFERDSALAHVAETFESVGGKLPPGTALPERKRVIARLVVDSEANLWVLNERGPDTRDFRWSVHDPTGRYLGDVATPVMAVTQIGDDFVAGTVRDELDVPRAVVFPLSKEPR